MVCPRRPSDSIAASAAERPGSAMSASRVTQSTPAPRIAAKSSSCCGPAATATAWRPSRAAAAATPAWRAAGRRAHRQHLGGRAHRLMQSSRPPHVKRRVPAARLLLLSGRMAAWNGRAVRLGTAGRDGGGITGRFDQLPGGQRLGMSALRSIARPMLASIFAVQGYATLRDPGRVAARAEPVVRQLAGAQIPLIPESTEDAVRLNGAVQVGAAALLAAGGAPGWPRSPWRARWSRRHWPGTRSGRSRTRRSGPRSGIQFLKNLAMLGGLLIAADAG